MHKVKATNTHNNWAVGHRRARLKHNDNRHHQHYSYYNQSYDLIPVLNQ